MRVYTFALGPLGANGYLLEDNGEAAFLDPGADGDELAALIAQRGVRLRYILATHGHFDHVGGMKALAAAYPQAECAMSGRDQRLLDEVGDDPMAAFYTEPGSIEGLRPGRDLLEGDVLPLGESALTVISTPGHSEGSICLLCENVLFSGDTLFKGSVGRTDLSGGSLPDLLRSLARLARLPGDLTVLPGHGDPTSMEEERARNPYLAEALRRAMR